jgi:hypothetical protein
MAELLPFVNKTQTGVTVGTQPIVTSEAPRPQISAGEVAQPYELLGRSLDKLGEGLESVAVPLAEQAGLKSVSRDDQGNLQVSQAPVLGAAGAAYSRAQKFSALAQGEAEAKRQDLLLSKQFPNDPNSYLTAAQKFREKIVEQYNAVSPEVGMSLGRSIDNQTTYNYRWLLLQQQRTIKENFDKDTKAAIQSKLEDIDGLLGTGAAETPEGRKAILQKHDEVLSIYKERISNPILEASKGEAALELKQIDERIGAGQFVSKVNQVLKDPQGGPYKAMDMVEGTLKDDSVPPNQRQINYAHGLAAIKDYEQTVDRTANMAAKQQKQKDQLFEDAVIRDTASGDPKVTENDIKTAPGISPESKMRMLSWVKRDGMPEPLGRVSQMTTMDLFRRMNLPEGDPQKITSLTPIRDAYAPMGGGQGTLKREDEEWLEKRFNESRTPEGTQLNQIRAQFSKAVEPTIDKSNPLLGKIDQSGKLQNYAFERFVDQKVDEYRKAGKNPFDLFDPNKPDYLGSEKTLQGFAVPLTKSIQNITRSLGGGAPAAPAQPQRKPGESPADYLKRTGQQ